MHIPPLLIILPLLHNTLYCYIEPALAPNVKEMQQNAIHLRHPGCPLTRQTSNGLGGSTKHITQTLSLLRLLDDTLGVASQTNKVMIWMAIGMEMKRLRSEIVNICAPIVAA